MISEALVCFSSGISYLIGKANEEEIPRYEKWIKIWKKILAASFGIIFPIYIPFAIVMYLSTDKEIKLLESIAFGASLTVGNVYGLLILLMYQLIEYRKRNLKEVAMYSAISFIVFLALYFLGQFSQWMAVGM